MHRRATNRLSGATRSQVQFRRDPVTSLLVADERVIAAYETFRDSAVFTTKRLIVRDAQGLRGKKGEIY